MSTPITIYCIPGLGLNQAIFQRLTLQANAIHYLDWLEPKRKEPLKDYAQRMADLIHPVPERLVLIGHSFGGVLIQELSKLLPVEHLILISSIKAKEEKTVGMNTFMRLFPLHQLATRRMITNSFKHWGKRHGYESAEAQAIFLAAANQHSDLYFRWATDCIVKWAPEGIHTPIIHLHGTQDKTFPFRRIKAPVLAIEGGSHFMVYNKAELLSGLMNQALAKLAD